MTKEPFLSVVVPVYNEAARLHGVEKIAQFLAKQKYVTEFIIVNDGSTDETLPMLEKLQKKLHFMIVSYPHNRGKGYAIKRGMLDATGKWHLFFDVDLSVPLSTIETLQKHLKGNQIIIGTRRQTDSEMLARQSKLRESFGSIFTKIAQVWLNLQVSDFTCGFKCFASEVSHRVFSQMHTERWGFDSEILFIAKQLGYQVKELPVQWKNDFRTKVKFPQDVIRSLIDLFEIRYHFFRGRYR